jgi:small subunit ribosomal protein S6
MALYESVIIGRQDLTNSQFEILVEEFVSVIKSHKGEIKKTEYWGIRNLAYKINKNRKGHYYKLNIDSSSETIAEYERLLGLHEDIIRFLTIRIDKIDDAPSPLINNKVDRHRNENSGDGANAVSQANV